MIKRILSLVIGIIFIFSFTNVYALSQQQWNSLYGDSIYYDPNQNNQGCSTTNSSGQSAPGGLVFPITINSVPVSSANLADAINTWISQKNPYSELSGLGSIIVASAQNSNINPFFIVSIAQKESSLASPTDYNIIHANNAFGREAAPGQPSFQGSHLWYKWNSVKDSVNYLANSNKNAVGGGDEASYLRAEFNNMLNSNNLGGVMNTYAPSGQNNTAQYITQIQQWMGELNNLVTQSSSSSSVSSGSSSTSTPQSLQSNSSGSCSVNCQSSTSSNLSQIRQQVVCLAQAQLSIWKSQPGYTSNGSNNFSYAHTGYLIYSQDRPEEWCADFVSWIFHQAGDPLSQTDWNISSVANIASIQNPKFTVHNQGSGYIPQPGDIAIHYSNQISPPYYHINIVVAVTGNSVTLIGGDQGGANNLNYGGSNSGSVVSEYTDNFSSNNFFGGSDNIYEYVSPN